MTTRRLALGLLSTVLSLALATAVTPAIAGPATPTDRQSAATAPGPPPKPKHTKTTQLSKKQKEQIALGARILHYSVSKTAKRPTMDYRKADKFDQGHPTARRRIVAGYIFGGGKVTHISKKELKKVTALTPKGDPFKKLPKNVFGKPVCEGRNGVVTYKPEPVRNFRIYANSCRTSLIIFTGNSVGMTMGAIGALLSINPATAALGMTVGIGGVIVGLGMGFISYLQDTSRYNSTWYRLKYVAIWAGRQ